MRKGIGLASLLVLLFSSVVFAAEKAIVLDINGAIGPATQDYVKRGILFAQKERAAVVIIQLNTPGGLETSMRGINEAIITSPVPVITYVAPSGARAASAGTFILYASHLSAMSPGTNVGAASPVHLMQEPEKGDSKTLSTAQQKAVNDAAAYIRSLAELRGRNADWADKAVRQGASLSAHEAKRMKVIDEIADDYPQLMQKLDGRKALVQGVSETVKTKDLQLEKMPTDWRYEFLSFITNPNIAYILMLIAIYGIFFELSNPGLVLPGVAGVISLLLVLYAFQLMPINYVGLTLVLLGIMFMILEVYVSSFGALGIGGVIAFIIGSVMLFDVNNPYYRLTWVLILSMSIITIAFFFIVISLAIKSHKKAIVSGQEGLIGAEGTVLSVMNEQVVVRLLGEIWEAKSPVMLEAGQKVKVTDIKGLTLVVIPTEGKEKKSGE
ncbi:NfeD family protein [Aquicella lusitana]|uniref:Membrane-bound serine protease (ClpP class) n=1 Tax=Aquicella lusitana TaxID=254246 RepID=A0A370GAJ3_9COXI|nr:nodulation protein NfeD [Aquicella lusitana]RDI40196.1 membrane-bound serine protease (ClpP class) [Aquicella lusitana]VVC72413.1 hypothetical protein AQULUS_01230 [Aquicella lusitana]